MIVALSLVALVGMLVLVVDVGGLLYARRQMVNGSDAAALSAAKACAMTTDTENPELQADTYAGLNVSDVNVGVTNIVADESVGCDTGGSGYVTVRYSTTRDLFFGPVLGSGTTADVTTEATADFGGIGWSDGIIPLVIYEGFFQGFQCDVPDVEIDTVCYLWEDNDLSESGNFGFLDVTPNDGWDVDEDANCQGRGSPVIEGWIDGSTPVSKLGINYPYATWVCNLTGGRPNPQVWEAIRDLAGQTKVFPVVGISPADNQPAQLLPPKAKYNVIGFAEMEIIDVLTVQNTAPATCTLNGPFDNPTDLVARGKLPVAIGGCGIPAEGTLVVGELVGPAARQPQDVVGHRGRHVLDRDQDADEGIVRLRAPGHGLRRAPGAELEREVPGAQVEGLLVRAEGVRRRGQLRQARGEPLRHGLRLLR